MVVATFVLSQWDRPLAEAVGLMLREQAAGAIVHDPVPVPVRDWLLEVPLRVEEGFLEPTNKQQCSVRAEAIKWIAEVRTMRWVRDENFNRGSAPAADATALHYAEEMVSLGESDHVEALHRAASSRSTKAKRTVRKWAARFRHRWRASLSNLAVRDVLPRPSLDEKAGVSQVFRLIWVSRTTGYFGIWLC